MRRPDFVARLIEAPAGLALQRFWAAGWGFDWLYDRTLTRPFVSLAQLNRADIVDRFYVGIARLSEVGYRLLSLSQTGRVRWYAASVAFGSATLVIHRGVRMILLWVFLVPLIGGMVAWLAERRGADWPRWVSLAVLAIDLALVVTLWAQHYDAVAVAARGTWFADLDLPWIPPLGIRFHLGIDGLSLLLILLTLGLGIMAVATSWSEITERVGFFHFNLLWTLAGTVGVFLALDLFLFFFFWELMLVPMYFLIAIWGHEKRVYAAIKFFLFTQGSGLLMFVAILALYLYSIPTNWSA